MIRLHGINKSYTASNKSTCHAIKDISLNFDNTGFVFILGKSGSGKSTLLNIIGGLDGFDSGEYCIFDRVATNLKKHEWDSYRNYYFGFIFQDFLLLPQLTVRENISMALELQDTKAYHARVEDILQKVELGECGDRKINELSGGQRQRVAIARALIKNPKVILADEPTGNLDEATGESIYKLLEKLSKDYLIILVTHDTDAALKYGDRIITLKDGRIESDEICQKFAYELYFSHMDKDMTFRDLKESEIAPIFKRYINCDNDPQSMTVRKTVKESKNETFSNRPAMEDAFKESRLRYRVAALFAMRSMGRHKLKVAFTLLFFSLTMFLLFFAAYAAMYDSNVSIANYFEKYQPQRIFTYKNAEYTSDFSQDYSVQIRTGKSIKDKLQTIYGEKNVYGSKSMEIFNALHRLNINAVFVDEIYNLEIIGNKPQYKNDIVLTDYVLHKLGIKPAEAIGTQINTDLRSFVLVGYVQTDFKLYDLESKQNSSKYTAYASERCNHIYARAYINKSFLTDLSLSGEAIELSCSDFINFKKEDKFLNSILLFGSSAWLSEESLLWGRAPQNAREIVISDDYAMYSGFGENIEDFDKSAGENYSFLNIHHEKYNSFYDKNLSIYEFLPQEVRVVGVYSAGASFGNEQGAYFLVGDDEFDKITSEYYSNYFFDEFEAIKGETEYAKIVSGYAISELRFNDANIEMIYSYDTALKGMLGYLWVILAVLILITIFMIISYVAFSIKDNGKTIGIFKALGVKNRDVIKIFIIESIVLCIVTLCVSTILHVLGLQIISTNVARVMFENPIDIFYVNFICLLGVGLFTFLTFFVSALFPILSILNKKPMEAIRNC